MKMNGTKTNQIPHASKNDLTAETLPLLHLKLPDLGLRLAELLLQLPVANHQAARPVLLVVVAAEQLVRQGPLPALQVLHLPLQEVDQLGLLGNGGLVPRHLARNSYQYSLTIPAVI